MRATLIEYSDRFPQVEISTFEDGRARLFSRLQNRTLDIAIVTGEPTAQVGVSMALWSERVLIAVPDAHRLATKEVLNWADLKRERFVLSTRDPGPEIESMLIAKLVTPGEFLDIHHHDANAATLQSLISAGRGITVICESCMGSVQPGIVVRETRGGSGSTRIGFRCDELAGSTACPFSRPPNHKSGDTHFGNIRNSRHSVELIFHFQAAKQILAWACPLRAECAAWPRRAGPSALSFIPGHQMRSNPVPENRRR